MLPDSVYARCPLLFEASGASTIPPVSYNLPGVLGRDFIGMISYLKLLQGFIPHLQPSYFQPHNTYYYIKFPHRRSNI